MSDKELLIDAALVRSFLSYDPETGEFRWLLRKGWERGAGRVAGSKKRRGYVDIGILGTVYQAHRLAWLHYHGEWPKQQIDHINRVRDDNRIVNLRDVSYLENARNKAPPKVKRKRNPHPTPRSRRIPGSVRERGGRFEARIGSGIPNKYLQLGTYPSRSEAELAITTFVLNKAKAA